MADYSEPLVYFSIGESDIVEDDCACADLGGVPPGECPDITDQYVKRQDLYQKPLIDGLGLVYDPFRSGRISSCK